MPISLTIGLDAISSYKRLTYTPWHAIAELVDNSTQSYFNNHEILDKLTIEGEKPLSVTIDYSLTNSLLRVTDNAMGMSYDELQAAVVVAKAPQNTTGRSKYGMGLKTSACWIGNSWSIITKKLGETTEHKITVDVDHIAQGDNTLPYECREGLDENSHYTIVEITRHNRQFKGRTLGKIHQFLSSMYREDFRAKILTLIWQSKVLEWIELDDSLLLAHDGSKYKKDFSFEVQGAFGEIKRVWGWVGVLRSGSRSKAGFSILHSGRVVKGWPQSWRPSTLFGQEEGSNDLVNQRLVGEIHLDSFEVSHTKDDILWLGDEIDKVEDELLAQCKDYREVALTYRKGRDDRRGPTEVETAVAISTLQEELESPELADVVSADPMLPEILVEETVRAVTESVVGKHTEQFFVTLDILSVKGFVEADMSPNDPYVTIDSTKENDIVVIINAAHPHWNSIEGAAGVLNYLRHCTYDGIAEWQAMRLRQRMDSKTIKILKDRLLRIPLDIERHAIDVQVDDDGEEVADS